MYCINCGSDTTKVIDSRNSDEGNTIRRRRECINCNNRFTTFEKIEIMKLVVNKTGDRKQKYSREKLEESILMAINKRCISVSKVNDIIKRLEFNWIAKKEISSKEIGESVLKALLELDEVAYIRYASVHLKFNNSKDFIKFIKHCDC